MRWRRWKSGRSLSTVSVEPIKDAKTVDQYPAQLTPADSNLFYVVEDSSNAGEDLVVSNSGGTQVLKDFPAAATSGSSAPSQLTAVGNDVDFTTSAGSGTAYDNLLWQSNGTASGTAQVSIPGTTVTTFESLTDLNGTLIVTLEAGSGIDNQMWAIGGNNGTPTLIKDFGASYATPDQVIGDTLYFSVDGDLWATGGAAGNTQAVGGSVATPRELVAFKGQAYYFDASGGQVVFGTLTPSGEDPGRYRGDLVHCRRGGVGLVPVLRRRRQLDQQGHPALVDGRHAGRDPARRGLQLDLTPVRPPEPDRRERDPLLHPGGRGRAGGALAIQRHQPGHLAGEGSGHECPVQRVCGLPDVARGHRRDGVLRRLRHDPRGGVVGDQRHVPGHALGSSRTSTRAPPTRTRNGSSSSTTSSTSRRTTARARSRTSSGRATARPAARWRSHSGSPGVTQGSSSLTPGSTDFATLGSELLLPLEDGIHGTELWATDGTSSGTVLLAPVNPRAIAVLGDDAYFLGTRPTSPLGLWKTDGTAAGTTEILDLSQYEGSSSYFVTPSLVASGGKLYFSTGDGSGGVDLWSSGGTAAGTSVVKDFTAPSGESFSNVSISDLTAFDGELAFLANDGTHGTQLWVSNGTGSGTQMLTDVSTSDQPPSDPTVAGSSLYFFAPDPSTSDQDLWVTNGTVGGTSKVASIPSVTPSGQSTAYAAITTDLTAVGSRVYFLVQYDYSGSGQGSLEATTCSTLDERRHVPGHGGGCRCHVERLDVYQHGRLPSRSATCSSSRPSRPPAARSSLWKSDGTAVGTRARSRTSAAFRPYPVFLPIRPVLAVNGILYFAANDDIHGDELWQSNGIPAGTGLVSDINPGLGSSNPLPLASLGGQLVLVADDGIHGEQLMEAILHPHRHRHRHPHPHPRRRHRPRRPQPTPPRIASIPTQAADEGTTIQVNLGSFASDPNSPALSLTYSLGAGAPSGVSVNPTSGMLTWTVPAEQTIGLYPVTIVATASGTPAQSTSATFNLDVIDSRPGADHLQGHG